MKTKEKISIDAFDGKRFQIRLVEPKDYKKDVLTPYLLNKK
jgi:DNA (cytosine-5)-methyltransferase 1